ncbi:hypothetical protein KI387_040512, partial [Taxus chinensis]
ASRCHGITGVEPPPRTTEGLQSLTFAPYKDHLLSINEKQTYCNRKNRQVGPSLKNQEAPNDHFVQPDIKKRKLDVIHHCVSGGRHQRELEDEKQRKLTWGKAVEDQSHFLILQGIKRKHLPRHEVSKEYLLKPTLWNRSKSSEVRKMINITEYQAKHTVGKALETAAENSCSSVSSSESFTARDCSSLGKQSLSKLSPDMNDGILESSSLYMNGKGKKITSGEKQAIEVHRLESLAYRSVLNALRARGHLGWHHELLLTDLRLSLHITSDEHRLELTNMCSAQDVQL